MKDSIYSISIDRTREQRDAFKTLLNEKKELSQKDMWLEWMYIMKSPPCDPKTQCKITLNNSSANSSNLFVRYTNADNVLNKRSKLLTIISVDDPDIICIYNLNSFVQENLPNKIYYLR